MNDQCGRTQRQQDGDEELPVHQKVRGLAFEPHLLAYLPSPERRGLMEVVSPLPQSDQRLTPFSAVCWSESFLSAWST